MKTRKDNGKKLARLSSRMQLVIPRSIAGALWLKPGDLLNVEKKNNTILMTPVEVVEKKKAVREKV